MPTPVRANLLTGFHQRRCDLRGCERRAYASVRGGSNAYCERHLRLMANGILTLEREQEGREAKRPHFILPEDMH